MPQGSRRPLWPVLTAALVLLPVVYVLGCAPLLWLNRNGYLPDWLQGPAFTCLMPMALSFGYGPEWWQHLLEGYFNLWGCTLRIWPELR